MSSDVEQFQELIRDVPKVWRGAVDRRLSPLGLSQAKWRVLYHIGRRRLPVTQTELADDLGIETPSLVRLLDLLADDGWIERRVCSEDRRARRLHLTPKAKKVYVRIRSAGLHVRKRILADISAVELQQCIAVLGRVKAAAEAELSKPVGGGP